MCKLHRAVRCLSSNKVHGFKPISNIKLFSSKCTALKKKTPPKILPDLYKTRLVLVSVKKVFLRLVAGMLLWVWELLTALSEHENQSFQVVELFQKHDKIVKSLS